MDGHLIILVGADGIGRRAFLKRARQHGAGRSQAIFPKRYICGPMPDAREDFVSLSPAMFSDWSVRDFFAFSWSDRCCRYAVGREIEIWLDAGLTVVVSVGYEAVPTILDLYPDTIMVLVDDAIVADPAIKERCRNHRRRVEVSAKLLASPSAETIDWLLATALQVDTAA